MFQEHILKLNVYHPIMGNKIYELSAKDNFSDLRSALSETSLLMLYENYYFKVQGKQFSEYSEIGQTLTNGSRVNILFDLFDQRSSKYHFQKVKLILQNPYLLNQHLFQQESSQKLNQKQRNQKQFLLSEMIQQLQNQSYLQQSNSEQHNTNLSQLINYSGFNYPPYYRKMAGDFYYLVFKSPEQIDYHITANSQGFFVNQSSSSHFNPNISFKFQVVNASLLDLLYKLSPKFKFIYQSNCKSAQNQGKNNPLMHKREQWLKRADSVKKNFAWKINSLDRHLKRQDFLNIKDWSQILQIQNSQINEPVLDKIAKQKMKFKIYQQFIQHSKTGAMQIVEHNLSPINPDLPKMRQTFLYSSILFSFADSITDQQQVVQSKSQSYLKIKEILRNVKSKQANNYILNLQKLQRLSIHGLHLSHLTLIKYKGYKIKAQSLPASIFYSRKQYCSFDDVIDEKTLDITHKQIEPIVKSIARAFNIQTQNFILNPSYQNCSKQVKANIQKAGIHPQIKWIQNKDRKKYILNLQNLSPKDTNFPNNKEHLYRPELVALYNQKQKCLVPINLLIGKSKYTLINNQKIKDEENKLKSIGYFAKQVCIYTVITLLEDDLKKYLADSKNIIQIMHKYGLNCRYLGILYNKVDAKKSPQLKISIQRTIFVKSLKNFLNAAIKSSASSNIKSLIAYILNLVFFPDNLTQEYLESLIKIQPKQQETELFIQTSKKKKKKWNKQKQKEDINLAISSDQQIINFLTLTATEIEVIIKNIAIKKYNFKFQQKLSTLKCLNVKYGKSAILRDVCLNIGLVVQDKNYFCHQNVLMFQPQNILEFTAKHTCIHLQNKQVQQMIDQADRKSALFQVEQSIQAYNRAIQYILTTYGGIHEKLALIHKKMSNIYFKIGDIQTALLFAHNSCSMLEQILGRDNVETIQNKTLLGFYYCAKRNYKQSQAYLLKSIYYGTMAYSQTYPQLLTLYMNLSTVYQVQKKYPQAIMSLVQGLNIVRQIYGTQHIHLAIFYAALASLHLQIPDIQKSIRFQQQSVSILKRNLPQNDGRLKQSTQMLEYYEFLQSTKKIKQMHEKEQRKINSKYFKNINKVTEYNFLKENQEFWRKNRRGKFFF